MPDEPVSTASQAPYSQQPAQPVTPKQPSRTNHFKSIWVLIPLFLVFIGGVVYYSMKLYENTPVMPTIPTPHVDNIKTRGTIRIGTDATYPPMEFKDSNNTLVGYDIDLGKRIAQELGVTAEFVEYSWDDVFQALLDNHIDVIISSVSITDERMVLYNFSEPYINAGQVIITNKGNTTITSTEDLYGKNIGVQDETTNEEQALLYTPDERVIRYDDFIKATQALVNGEVDAIFSDLTNAKSIIDENPTLTIASEPFTSEYYGIVMRKGEDDLVEEIDDILDTLKQKGVLALLKQKWLE